MTDQEKTSAAEEDINDIFEDILLTEERLTEQGYSEGYEKGIERGNSEAYHLGYHRGAEIGAEIGLISASIENLPESANEKVANLLQNLKTSIDNFPKTNDESVNLHEALDSIKIQYKKLMSLMKIKISSSDKKEISF